MLHPMETVLEEFDFHGIRAEVIRWAPTVWCGFSSFADRIACEPEVEAVTENYRNLPFEKMAGKEDHWDACLSFGYLSENKKHGMMYAFLTDSEEQPCECEIRTVPETLYMRIRLNDETARALGHEPWNGGIPPYEWIGEQIAPQYGYTYGDPFLPIVEYYGYFNLKTFSHDYRYLYVPVQK